MAPCAPACCRRGLALRVSRFPGRRPGGQVPTRNLLFRQTSLLEPRTISAGAGLCPAGSSQRRGERPSHVTSRRLLKPLKPSPARKEGARGGTRGSPTVLLV